MPSDPKKPIEEMLEASAKARRAAFGKEPVMPNPLRARLHDEISRVPAERHEAAPERSWLQIFWPRVAVAAALATILVVGPMIWYQSRSVNIAQADNRAADVNKPGEAAARTDEAFAQGPAAAAAPSVSLADNERAILTPEQTPAVAANSLDESKIEAEAQTPADAVVSASDQVTKGFIAKEDKATETGTASANLQPAAPATSRLAAKDGLAAPAPAPAAASAMKAPQHFAQQAGGQAFRNSTQTNRSSNILDNFQVQQQGTDIRIVDSDGSTYIGKLEPLTDNSGRALAKAKRAYASRAESDQKEAAQSQSRFRAAGYNVTLKKPVVVDAEYSTAGAPEQLQREKAQPPEIQNAPRIIGTARVNGEPPVQIDATAVRQ